MSAALVIAALGWPWDEPPPPPEPTMIESLTESLGGIVDLTGLHVVLPPTALAVGVSCAAAQLILTGFFYCLPPGPWKSQPGYTAHRIISFTTMVYVTWVGSAVWFFPDEAFTAVAATPTSRIIAAHPVADHLGQVLLGLNVVWDIPAGFLVESLRVRSNATLMIIHHLVVVLLCYLTLQPPRFQYYIPFFFGVIECSSAPMSLMDLCHPRNVEWSKLAQTSKALGACNAGARVLFAVSFLLARALCFPYVIALGVLRDIHALLSLPTPPVSPAALVTVGLSGVGLTLLQLHWAKIIVDQVRGVAAGGKQGKAS